MNYQGKKIAVALSGGVDSSVTAFLLKQSGAQVIALTGDMFGDKELTEKASETAKYLGIEHIVLDLKNCFQKNVVEYFENTYEKGFTPNPCVMCNKSVKWGKLFDYAFNVLKVDYFATGHYANISCIDGIYRLERARCDDKDQLYFLFALGQEELKKTIFPLGQYTSKDEIREIAQKNGLPSKSYKDSQGICFIKKPMSVKKYLSNKFKEQRGKVFNISTGKVIGKHTGYYQYTVGQRKGLGIAAEFPLYVSDINSEENIVYVGYKEDVYSDTLKIKDINWQQINYKNKEFRATAKVRYNTQPQPCIIMPDKDETVKIVFEKKIFGIARGQFCVIYDENNQFLIAGGEII